MNDERNAFLERLVIEMHDLLVKYATLKLGDHNSAHDAVQETYLAAQKNISKLMDSKNPQGWLIEALKFKVMHEKRAKAKFMLLMQRIALDITTSTPHKTAYENEVSEFLMKDEYEVLRSLYIDGYSIKEIAAKLGITHEACKKRIQTAKRKLAKELLQE